MAQCDCYSSYICNVCQPPDVYQEFAAARARIAELLVLHGNEIARANRAASAELRSENRVAVLEAALRDLLAWIDRTGADVTVYGVEEPVELLFTRTLLSRP